MISRKNHSERPRIVREPFSIDLKQADRSNSLHDHRAARLHAHAPNAARSALGVGLLLLLAAQIWLAQQLRHIPPDYGDLGAAPSRNLAVARALGDPQLAFRASALAMQHTGSLDGRIVGYRELDYVHIADWLKLLDRLDPKSVATPTMAAFLFRNPDDPAAMRPLVSYLARHARRDPTRNWRWMAHAVHLAQYFADDPEWALMLAREMKTWEAPLPYWAQQLDVFILVDLGEQEAAIAILEGILLTEPGLPESERAWIHYYINRKLTPKEQDDG